ncbi:MAG: alternate-type signal peptide domain-containing protein [Nocardioides sp.]
MNKMIKGSIAGATGVALLMGGFGTYALWSDTADLAENGVQSGVLTIDTADGAYDDARTEAANDWTANDLMVPGDVITYTQAFDVAGTGKNLQGTIELDVEDLVSDFSTLTYDVDVVASGSGATDITKVDNNSFTFADPFGTATLTATVTYTLPSTTGGTVDQNKSASTPASTFTISQS